LSRLRAEARDGAWDAELTSFFAAALSEETPAPVTSRHMRQKMAPPPRVLCVDDNPVNRDLIAASLAGTGFQAIVRRKWR